MLKFCEFPGIDGLVSLCTSELVSFIGNIYLVVLTIFGIIFVRTQKKKEYKRWSCHTLIWVSKHFYCILIVKEVIILDGRSQRNIQFYYENGIKFCFHLIWHHNSCVFQVLLFLNCIGILLSSTVWLIIVKTEAIVVYQALNILAFVCLPLAFNLFEQKLHPK